MSVHSRSVHEQLVLGNVGVGGADAPSFSSSLFGEREISLHFRRLRGRIVAARSPLLIDFIWVFEIG